MTKKNDTPAEGQPSAQEVGDAVLKAFADTAPKGDAGVAALGDGELLRKFLEKLPEILAILRYFL